MISIVIPIYNEEAIIQELFDRTTNALLSITDDFEIICVDDGSHDKSLMLLKKYHRIDKRFKVISLSRNFGHQPAIFAGLSYAQGDYIGIMDGDLQDPPESFKLFFNKIKEGYDVVFAVRKKRKEWICKRFAYWLYYRILKAMSETKMHLDSGDFSMFTKEVLENILKMPEQSLFIRGLRTWVGFRQTQVEYERDSRMKGTPKYTLKKLFQLAKNGMFSFSYVPIKFLGRLGLIIIVFSIIYTGFLLFKKFYYGNVPEGFTSVIIAIIFFSGVQLVSIRILGEYIVRIYDESRNRPLFIIKEKELE